MDTKQKQITIEDIPIVDLKDYLAPKDKSQDEITNICKNVSQSFHEYGICIIRDPRVNFQDNSDYIDLMEKYFDEVSKPFYAGEELDDVKPEYHYLVGATPEKQEKARRHEKKIKTLTEENLPMSPIDPVYDAKWRYSWKIGQRPQEAMDDFPQVVPSLNIDNWEQKMDKWGNKLHDAVKTVAEMAAVGMGLQKDQFTKCIEGGAHLLAPTGTDLAKNGNGSILAGFHYDISFLTIHGKSRFPGLYVWLRNNQKLQVKVPDGCLLLQAGITFEHITGGYVHAGFHEVVCNEQTVTAFEKAKQNNKITWRISSTLFANFRYNVECEPIPEISHLYNQEDVAKYPKRTAYDILMTELAATNMVPENEYQSQVKYEQYEEEKQQA